MSVIGPGINKKFYTALSTDIWPTIDVPIGSELYALDSGTNYIFDFTGTWSVLYKKVLLEDISTVGIEATSSITIASGINLLDENGTPYGVKHVNNKPRISSTPYYVDIAEGNVSGHTPWKKTGFNDDVDIGSENLWTVGGLYVYPTSAMQMEVVSSSGDDASGGTGIKTVELTYLTSDFTEGSEIITLNGTSTVTTVATNIYRVNNFRAKTVGTGGKAAGNIDVRHRSGSPIYSRISTNMTRARNSAYTVPKDKKLYVTNITFSVGGILKNEAYTVRFTTQAKYDNVSGENLDFFMPYSEVLLEDMPFTKEISIPTGIPAGVDINVLATAYTANCMCISILRGWLEDA